MDYDVLILGGGIVGCTVAYELSKYNLNIAVIERDYDVADDIAVANTAVVYDGSETSNAVMAGLENIGIGLVKEACEKFKVPYKTLGSLRLAKTDLDIEKIKDMYRTARNRGILGVEILDREEILEIEPNITDDVKMALYSKNTGIVSPYDLALSYAEIAFDNGVNFRLEEEVNSIQKINKGFFVETNKNKFKCRFVINTIPDEIYVYDSNKIEEKEITSQKNMNYFLVENKLEKNTNTIVIEVVDDRSFVINTPMITGGNMLGVKNPKRLNIHEGIHYCNKILPELKKENISDMIREEYKRDEIFIDDSELKEGYIRITGKHYGKHTIAPAIAENIRDTIVNLLNSSLKKDFVDKRRESYRFRELDKEEINELIRVDKRYGNIICVCNKVSEGEIVDCIRRPLGARTIEGIRKRTGAGFGNCHGSHCIRKLINILAREMDKKPSEIVRSSKNSKIVIGRIKEFDEV
ncbi:NAD(P)/FAD-dependent oxidoreductase [Clostridium chrysemydis]|uniref:NAD(P)/FAD-dependent oxidoreductase n=1 Tax=Clostridium chrysemydis TaxID=2665504 RepID=UPI0018843F3A|nr:FAD-dependent oxidoreductase [Clostridium chrysemydis]